MKSILLVAILFGALLFGAASASTVLSDPSPPLSLCRVLARASPDRLPGLYTVVVRVTTTLQGQPCSADGYALVQLEGGRTYPLSAVRAGEPYLRSGVPWYWRLYWTAASGRRYRVPIAGLNPPFSETTP